MKFFLCVLGMVFIVEGLPYVAFPGKLKAYLSRLITLPDSTLQFLGLIAMLFGVLLVYFGRS
ncbi:MAG: hypothetical protein A4E70_00172 [Syntrophus sp. PtaU1.Bin005]|jgi:uncharacterized protein YjeT (DUF2065 family)|uniref:DUF2065 domain-containing protein n=1 Tax=Syntrophus TaxID=43773 RepID=UPI0009D188B9|nr:MAG: hypothetical protein A4E69_03017 [Syntrophus sp. PtaB.Bin138]OPY83662.1 MAG: hypothetical protein A4E70_00172 [Syntrophus sp. PtaU1.Bin005]